MADVVVTSPAEYYPNPDLNRPIFNGTMFIGEPDLDPEIVANQIQVKALQENGSTVNISQPISISSGGVPVDSNGDVYIKLLVGQNYSQKVLDKNGNQKYFIPNAFTGNPVTSEQTAIYVDTVEDMKSTDALADQIIITKGYFSIGDGGGGEYLIVSSSSSDGDVIHQLNNGNFAIPQPKNGVMHTRVAGITGAGTATDSRRLQNLANFCKDNTLSIVSNTEDVVILDQNINVEVSMELGTLSLDGNLGENLNVVASETPVVIDPLGLTGLNVFSDFIGGLPAGLEGHSLQIESDEILTKRYQSGVESAPYKKFTCVAIQDSGQIYPTLDMTFTDLNLIFACQAFPPEKPVTLKINRITSSLTGDAESTIFIKRNNTTCITGKVQSDTAAFRAVYTTQASFLKFEGGSFGGITPAAGTGYTHNIALSTDVELRNIGGQDAVLEQLWASNIKVYDSYFRTLGSHWTNTQKTVRCIIERMPFAGKDMLSIDDEYQGIPGDFAGSFGVQIRDDTPEGLGYCRFVRPIIGTGVSRLFSMSVLPEDWERDINLFDEVSVVDPVLEDISGQPLMTIIGYQVEINTAPIPNVVQPTSVVVRNVRAPQRQIQALGLAADNAVNGTTAGLYQFEDINSLGLGFTNNPALSVVIYRAVSGLGQTNIDFRLENITNGMTNISGTVRNMKWVNSNVFACYVPTTGEAARINCVGCTMDNTVNSTTNQQWDYSNCYFLNDNNVGGRVASCLGSRAAIGATNEPANVDTFRSATYYKV